FAAWLALTKLLMQEERREQVVLLASSKEQARICYDAMTATIRADEHLASKFEIIDFRSMIRFPASDSRATAVAADVASLTGFTPSFAVVDELHLLGLCDKGRRLVTQIRTGNVSRREPMMVSISTAPPDRSEGIFNRRSTKPGALLAVRKSTRISSLGFAKC